VKNLAANPTKGVSVNEGQKEVRYGEVSTHSTTCMKSGTGNFEYRPIYTQLGLHIVGHHSEHMSAGSAPWKDKKLQPWGRQSTGGGSTPLGPRTIVLLKPDVYVGPAFELKFLLIRCSALVWHSAVYPCCHLANQFQIFNS